MRLRTATLFVLVGSVYIVLHKVGLALFPDLSVLEPSRTIVTSLWIAATCTVMLFAYEYLVELVPRSRWTRYSLLAIVAFTAVTVLLELSGGQGIGSEQSRRLAVGFSTFGNAVALLLFVASLTRLIPRRSGLWRPAWILLWSLSATCFLRVVSLGYLVQYSMTGEEAGPFPLLQPIAGLVFLCTYGATIWFLAVFYRIPDYAAFVGIERNASSTRGI